MSDLAEKLHRALWGRSGRANAPGNQSEDFQAGFDAADERDDPALGGQLTDEWNRRGQPEQFTPEWRRFSEWKRGLFAARMQRICAEKPCAGDEGA